jgi:DNA-binding NarL/FixJ family response regulator
MRKCGCEYSFTEAWGGCFVRVLIVDDQDYICRGLRALLLEQEDIEVCGEARNGHEAITKVGELLPDVVLMDISLPGLDGLQATREIRKRFPAVQVVTLSQYEIPDVWKAAMQAGAVTHVPKSSVWSRLLPTLRDLSTPSEHAEGDPGAGRNIRVLIADDHEVIRRGLRAIFSRTPVEICGEAVNGSEAITKTLELKPDLLILDLTMPIVGGFEAATEIRKRFPRVPILFYSINVGAQIIAEAQRIGVRGFVSKGSMARTLLEAVTTLAHGGTFFSDPTDINVVLG